MGDELFPRKDGQLMTSDIDYVDVWRVRTCELFVCIYSSAHPSTITVFVDVLHLCGHLTCFCCCFVSLCGRFVSLCCVLFSGDGSPAGLGEGEEHRCVQLQHPAAGETSRSVQGAPCCQSGE